MARKHNPSNRSNPSSNAEPILEPQDRVRERAHQIYTERCHSNTPGDEVSDWLKAEQELRHGATDGQAGTDGRSGQPQDLG